ncbi:MAG: hypothetical protein LRZ84_07265 [Desertifilum sp.]|nr:hypothetical protein [Desertifilum sp.]
MYVYRTTRFNQKAEAFGLRSHLDRLELELESLSFQEVQAHFKRLYPYLKRKADNNLRLIAKIVRVEETPVLCLLDIFKRGDREYEVFLKNRQAYGQQHLEPLLKEAQLRQWLVGRLSTPSGTPTIPPIQACPELLPWFDPPGWKRNTQEALIYESQVWLSYFKQPENRNSQQYQRFNELLITLIEQATPLETATDWPGVTLDCDPEREHYILLSRILAADEAPQNIIFLLAPFTHQPTPDEIREVGLKNHLLNGGRNILAAPVSIHEIRARARRAYPSYILLCDNWLALDGTQEMNLALSAEEEAILHSVSQATFAQNSLPLFLNGRAGSGKSTMLFYLFADYCYRKFYPKSGQELPGEPLFLTYNERLLDVAKDKVYQILTSHHRFVMEIQDQSTIPSLERYFQPFQKFLLRLLPPEVSPDFTLENYISFHRFKQLYRRCSLPSARRYSPERCWHAIRTFIKGYGLTEVTPEEYQEEVPRKERTVPLEQFEDIYEIWKQWYEKLLIEERYWDDQDLVKAVLSCDAYEAKYTAIFCDEAQDFTRLELQLIMRLSIFSRYDLAGYRPIYSLPFAFAGDPFQTLNPTGFRWESFQAAFYSEVIHALDPTEKLNLGMNFQELEFNYRSSSPIVQFNNLIQLWRYLLFDLQKINPQTVWRSGDVEPKKFVLQDNISLEELRSYIQDTILIIPCEEGEESNYIRKDEILSAIFTQWEDSDSPKNVLSAIAAKGLEFKRVILYKFGESCDAQFGQFLQKAIALNSDVTEPHLEIEYFFNKLYVAASRAIERLFIIDSRKGDRQLWQFASNLNYLNASALEAKISSSWKTRVRSLQLGTPDSAQELREDDPESIAIAFEQEGLNSQNPKLLRRAKRYYSDIGKINQAAVCEAWAKRYEQEFTLAGNAFLGLELPQLAWECFWEGLCWLELAQWYRNYPQERPAEKPIVEFMAETSHTPASLLAFTQFLHLQINEQQLADRRFSKQWQKAIAHYTQQIGQLYHQDTSSLTDFDWQTCGEVAIAFKASGFPNASVTAGHCFYRAQNYREAIECYQQHPPYPAEYYLAQALNIGFPEGLAELEKVGDTTVLEEPSIADRIDREWKAAHRPQDPLWLKAVAPILEKKQRFESALQAYIQLDSFGKAKLCFERLAAKRLPFRDLRLWVRYLLDRHYWLEAIATLEKYIPRVRASEYAKLRLECDVVYFFACASSVGDKIAVSDRKRYETYIKNRILANPEWQNHLYVEHIGIALEKIGGLGVTLSFYQGYCEDSQLEPQLRQWMRERWLVTKKKQEAYHRNKGKNIKAESNHREIVEKSQEWGVAFAKLPFDPPAPPTERPAKVTEDAPLVPIRETPRSTPQTGEVQQFRLRHLSIRVMKATRQIAIADRLNRTQVRVDLANLRLIMGGVTVEMQASCNNLRVTLAESGYQLTIVSPTQVQLDVTGEETPFAIEW